MDFITYHIFELQGINTGLAFGKYLWKQLVEGGIISPILYLFLFLSLVRIGIDGLANKDWKQVGKHIAFLFIFLALYGFTYSANIYNLNLTKGLEAFTGKETQTQNDTGNIGSTYRPIPVNDVPLIYILPSAIDQFSFILAKTFLSPEMLNYNTIKRTAMVNPDIVVQMAYIEYIKSAGSVDEMQNRLSSTMKCLGFDENNVCQENDNACKKVIKGVLERAEIDCEEFYTGFSLSLASIYTKIFDRNSEADRPYFNLYQKLVELIKQGTVPQAFKDGIRLAFQQTAIAMSGLKDLYEAGDKDVGWFQQRFNHIFSIVNAGMGNLFASRTYHEFIMFRVQGFVETIFFFLFPVIITLAFLPVFGYNLKLLYEYLIGYFLVKMWIPVYLLGHQIIVGNAGRVLGTLSSYIFGTPAYASNTITVDPTTVDTLTQLNLSVSSFHTFDNMFLTMLATAIPSILGAGALFMLGHGLLHASHNAVKSGARNLMEGIGLLKLGAGVIAGASRIATGIGKIREGYKFPYGGGSGGVDGAKIIDGLKNPNYNPMLNQPYATQGQKYKGIQNIDGKDYALFEKGRTVISKDGWLGRKLKLQDDVKIGKQIIKYPAYSKLDSKPDIDPKPDQDKV